MVLSPFQPTAIPIYPSMYQAILSRVKTLYFVDAIVHTSIMYIINNSRIKNTKQRHLYSKGNQSLFLVLMKTPNKALAT